MFIPNTQGARSKTLAYTYLGKYTASSHSGTWSPGSFTAAEAGLLVCACCSVEGSVSGFTGISIGGTAADEFWGATNDDAKSTRADAAFGASVVAAGTHAFSCTHSNTTGRGIIVYAFLITGYSSSLMNTHDSDASTTSATTRVAILNIPAGGIGIFVGGSQDDSSGYSWSNATEISEDLNIYSTSYGAAVAVLQTGTLLSSHNETITMASSQGCIAGATWV